MHVKGFEVVTQLSQHLTMLYVQQADKLWNNMRMKVIFCPCFVVLSSVMRIKSSLILSSLKTFLHFCFEFELTAASTHEPLEKSHCSVPMFLLAGPLVYFEGDSAHQHTSSEAKQQ